MKRRDFVKAVATVSAAATTGGFAQQAAPPAPAPAAPARGGAGRGRGGRGGYQAAPPPMSPATVADLVGTADRRFFTPEQFATLRQLCALMMPPRNGYPGAVDAGVPEFLDFLVGATPGGRQQTYFATIAGPGPARQVITGSTDRQQMYVAGLDRLEAEARRRFAQPFAALSAAQADALLAPALAPWMADHPPRDAFQRFVNVAHQDIRTATMNSAVWSAAAVAAGERAPGTGLYWSPIDPMIERYT